MSVDLGKVSAGKSTRIEFLLRNVGKDRLLIRGIKATCSCIVSEPAHRALLPGEHEILPIYFRSITLGPMQQTVVLETNDSQRPVVILKVAATVVSQQSPEVSNEPSVMGSLNE